MRRLDHLPRGRVRDLMCRKLANTQRHNPGLQPACRLSYVVVSCWWLYKERGTKGQEG